MARSEFRHRVTRRLQGVAFLAVVAALLGLTIAIYNKSLPWQASDKVTLVVDRIGNQLVIPADVKLDGVLVGRVSGAHTDGSNARLTLEIDKSVMKRHEIPADVVARILPKTLFGEKFVDLVIPPNADTSTPLRPGGLIEQDHSSTAIELQTVFKDLIPVLKALNPAQLSIALSNIADALRDRGNALGDNLELINQYFTTFNKDLPNFEHDISGLADLASNYADATPDLLSVLRNFAVNAKTFTVKQDVFAQFLSGTQGFATTATQVFGQNANRLITLAKVSQPVLDLYQKYSIVLECLPNGMAIYDRTRLEQVFGQGNYLHITLTPVGDRGPYTASDRNKLTDLTSINLPANCYGLPYGNHALHPVNSAFPGPHPSGNYDCAGTTAPPSCPTNPTTTSGTAKTEPTTFTGDVGSPDEQSMVAALLSPMIGANAASDAGLADLLIGPLLRGMAVSVS